MITELVTKTVRSTWHKGKTTTEAQWDHYTREGDTRTILHLETTICGKYSMCRKYKTLVGMAEGDDFYREGGRVEIPLKEAKAMASIIEKLTETASDCQKAGHDITTWYF